MLKLPLLFLSFLPLLVFSQIGPEGWQDHISTNSCNSVTKSGSTVYASNRSGLIYFDEKELSPKLLSKINGLSDVGIRLLRANDHNGRVLVIYDNCNIDVISPDRSIRNYPDFKMKSLSGKKLINQVTFYKQFAYLACGFGIVVFDTDKMEIRDTYIIGPNASDVDVQQVALNDSLIFAATSTGMYWSNHKLKVLNNYKSWTLDSVNLPKGFYAGVINVNNNIIACYTPSRLSDSLKSRDTIYNISPVNKWQKYPPYAKVGHTILRMGPVYQNKFSLIDATSLLVLTESDGKIVNHLNSFNGIVDYGQIRDAYMAKDHTGNLSYWVADNRFGLYQTLGYFPYEKQNQVTRNGTNHTSIGNIDVNKGILVLSPSLIDNSGVANYMREGINMLEDGEWKYLPVLGSDGTQIQDINSVLIDRNDKSQMWVTAWGTGVMKFKDKKLVASFTPTNTSMPIHSDQLPRCGGLSMDKNGNVWFAHSDQKGFLGVINSEGKYQNLQFESGRFTRKTFADKNGLIWMLHERDGGVTVYKPGTVAKGSSFPTPIANFNYKVLNSSPSTGNLESMSVYTIAEDLDGRIWIGTGAGLRVVYNPSSIFSSSEYAAQPIKIVQDGNVELLLDKEAVTCIAIDGANNKWCGTQLGGVYCFSPDGLTQLYHFTKENSPLYSNTIIDLNYNEVTGDVFIGTDQGLQSFHSTIIAGAEDYSDIHSYPNPVKPGYQGNVYIRGLVASSIVRIADEAGNMVWETKSEGGQISWPVKDLSGTRVSTGVYIVYASTTNGDFRAVSKILVVN